MSSIPNLSGLGSSSGTVTITKTADATLSVSDVTNTIISNYGQGAAMTLTLPTAAANMAFLVIVSTTGNALHIKAAANDKLILDSIALDDGDKASLATPVAGNSASFVSFQTGASTYDWIVTPISGVWSDGGA